MVHGSQFDQRHVYAVHQVSPERRLGVVHVAGEMWFVVKYGLPDEMDPSSVGQMVFGGIGGLLTAFGFQRIWVAGRELRRWYEPKVRTG